MRLLPALGLAALLAAPAVSAQTTFGVKAGVQAATFTGNFDDEIEDSDSVDKQARLGFVGGVTADIGLTPNIAFRPEVLYSQKGYKLSIESDDLPDLEGSFTAKVDYLEVPLLVAYKATTLSGFSYSVELGPTLAYKLSTGLECDAEGGFADLVCDSDDEDDFNDEVNDFDIGGAIGATVGSGPFGVGLRYTQGFTNVPNVEDEDDLTARNSVFSATLHYKFGAQ